MAYADFRNPRFSIARIAELSRTAGIVDSSPQAWERVTLSRAIVQRKVAAGDTIYGTNTGIGSESCLSAVPTE
jgi:histidine ammonia-lyase